MAAAYDVEVAALLGNVPELERAVREAWTQDDRGRPDPGARDDLVEQIDRALSNGQSHARRSLEALITVDGRASASDDPAGAATAWSAGAVGTRHLHHPLGIRAPSGTSS